MVMFDSWALGCNAYELIKEKHPFYRYGANEFDLPLAGFPASDPSMYALGPITFPTVIRPPPFLLLPSSSFFFWTQSRGGGHRPALEEYTHMRIWLQAMRI